MSTRSGGPCCSSIESPVMTSLRTLTKEKDMAGCGGLGIAAIPPDLHIDTKAPGPLNVTIFRERAFIFVFMIYLFTYLVFSETRFHVAQARLKLNI